MTSLPGRNIWLISAIQECECRKAAEAKCYQANLKKGRIWCPKPTKRVRLSLLIPCLGYSNRWLLLIATFHIRSALLAQLQLIYQLSTRRAARYWVTNAQIRPSNASTTLVLGVVAWHAMLQESVSSLVRL